MSIINNTPGAWLEYNEEEDISLMNFVVEKAITSRSRNCIVNWCREFKEKSHSTRSVISLQTRIQMFGRNVPRLEGFDITTKVHLMFVMRVRVEREFLLELRKDAIVDLDSRSQITYYNNETSGLQLGENRMAMPFFFHRSAEIDSEMLIYLAEKSNTTTKPIIPSKFVNEFKEASGAREKIGTLKTRYCEVRKSIYSAGNLDENTKIKCLFLASSKITESQLEEMKSKALVKLDHCQRLTEYVANDGSFVLRGHHSHSIKNAKIKFDLEGTKLRNREEYYKKREEVTTEKRELMSLLEKKLAESTTTILNLEEFVDDYVAMSGTERPRAAIREVLRRLRYQFHEMSGYDKETRITMIFVTSTSIDASLLNELRNNAIVEVDSQDRITKYEANEGGFTLSGDHVLAMRLKRRSFQKRGGQSLKENDNKRMKIYGDGDEEEQNSASIAISDEADVQEGIEGGKQEETDILDDSGVIRYHLDQFPPNNEAKESLD